MKLSKKFRLNTFQKKAIIALLSIFSVMHLVSCADNSDFGDSILFGFTAELGEDTGTTVGISISSPSGAYSVPEDGTLEITAVLTKKPSASVTVPISLSSGTVDATLNASSLTFTPLNWKTPQSIIISGVEEGDVDGIKVRNLVFGTVTSDDPEYNNYSIPSIEAITIMDNDPGGTPAAAIVITALREPILDRIKTTELGGTATFAVVLNRAPANDVVIPTITSDTLTEGTIDKSTLTFTPANWSIPQIVTATGVDDIILDNDQNYAINLADSTSADGDFNGLKYYYYAPGQNAVPAINIDNEVPSVLVTPTTLNLTEGGAAQTFNVQLSSKPTGNVTISLTNPQPTTSDHVLGASIDKTSLTFTIANYLTPQTVTVTPGDNLTKEATVQSFVIDIGTATGGGYTGTEPDDVTVNITDNDTPGVIVSDLSRPTTDRGQDAYFTVKLKTKPKDNVTIALNEAYAAVNSSYELGTITSPASRKLLFTPANWNTNQTVTIAGTVNETDDDTIQYAVDLRIHGDTVDSVYGALTPAQIDDVLVNHSDTDTASFVITKASNGMVTDDMGVLDKNTYSWFDVKLGCKPKANVTLNLSSSQTADGTPDVSSLTFTPSNWSTNQRVKVHITHPGGGDGAGNPEGSNEGNRNYSINMSKSVAAPGDAKYSALSNPSVTLRSCDNDGANKIVSCYPAGNRTSTSESGGGFSMWFIAQQAPTATLTLGGISSSNTAEGTVSSSSVSITSGDWDTLTTNKVTISGVDDGIKDNDQTYTINVGTITSVDAFFDGFDVPNFDVVNLDDESTLDFTTSGSASENGDSGSLGMKAGLSHPSDSITFTVSCKGGSTECASICDSDGSNCVANKSVTLPAGNTDWVYVKVKGKDDNVADGNQGACVTFSTLSTGDANLNGLQPPDNCDISNVDNDKRIWVTAKIWSGNFNGSVTQLDQSCSAAASDGNDPSDGNTYKALLIWPGSRTTSTNWILQANTDYYRRVGEAGSFNTKVFTTDGSGQVSFPLSSAFNTTGSDTWWTGANTNWSADTSNNCNSWSGDNGFNGAYGSGNTTGTGAIRSGTATCDFAVNKRKVICVQQ